MDRSMEGRVEEVSKKVGGRFRLTALIQKRLRDYVKGGGAFMPSVKNTHELVGYILDEIEEDKIRLIMPGEEGSEDTEETEQQENLI
jgi:hypothetical protein